MGTTSHMILFLVREVRFSEIQEGVSFMGGQPPTDAMVHQGKSVDGDRGVMT